MAGALFVAGGCSWWEDDEPATPTLVPTVATEATAADSTPRASATPTQRPTSTPEPTERATATTVLSEAQRHLQDLEAQWAETDSVHFELDIDGETFLDANDQIELRGAEGDLARPESASAVATVYGGFIPFDVEIVTIGDDAYVTNFITGDWERAPAGFDFNPALMFDEDEGLGAVLMDLRDAEIVGNENVDGRRARHITGLTSEDEIDDLVAGQFDGDDILLDVWMDEESDELLMLRLAEPEAEDDPLTWTLAFSNHNEPVDIEAPDL
jgi:hypothetical protein